MRISAQPSLQTLGARHFWYALFTVLVALPLILGLTFVNQVFDWYSQYFIEPGIEQSLGFKGADVTINRADRAFQWYGIVSVTPGGVFDRAGVRVGDLPVGYKHGARTGLIQDLRSGRGATVTVSFVNRAAYEAGKYQPRAITIPVP